MNKDIEPINNKGERHGLWETYSYGKLWYKRFYHNGKLVGYEEWYDYYNGKLIKKRYHI